MKKKKSVTNQAATVRPEHIRKTYTLLLFSLSIVHSLVLFFISHYCSQTDIHLLIYLAKPRYYHLELEIDA